LDKSFAPRSQEFKFQLTAPHYFNLLFMLLVHRQEEFSLFLAQPEKWAHFSKMICDNLKNWPKILTKT
jgi:hypothetical protein